MDDSAAVHDCNTTSGHTPKTQTHHTITVEPHPLFWVQNFFVTKLKSSELLYYP
jgi:hypothetical protein